MKKALLWFRCQWNENPLFSTTLALLVMVLLQTAALGFNYSSFGAWWNAFCINWINVLRNNATVGIVSLGMTFVIISGGIDLAVGSTLTMTGALFLTLTNCEGGNILSQIGFSGWWLFTAAALLVLLFGTLLGELNGVLVAHGKIPPFIVTLGTMKFFRSVTQYAMQGHNPVFPRAFLSFSSLSFGRYMLMPILYWLLIALALYLISKKMLFGTHVIAVGSNEKAARLVGINTLAIKRKVYALSGLLVACAAIIQVCRIGSLDFSSAGTGYEMDSIAAVCVGGTRMSGGRGTVLGTVLGVLIIGVMNNLLNLLGVPPFLREAFKGVIVIVAVLLQKKESQA